MAFLKNYKRKEIDGGFSYLSEVTDINLKMKLIKDGDKKADFERLIYKNCPVISRGKSGDNNVGCDKLFENMDRKPLVIKICNAIHSLDATNRTKINVFNETVRFIKMMDASNAKEIFTLETVSFYVSSLISSYNSGVKGKTLSGRQNSIKALLRSMDYQFFRKCEGIFNSFPDDSCVSSPYTDDEVKALFSALRVIYDDYSKHIKNGTNPTVFPLYEKSIDDNFYYKNGISSIGNPPEKPLCS